MKKLICLFLLCLLSLATTKAQTGNNVFQVKTDSLFSEKLQAWRAYNVLIPSTCQQHSVKNLPVLFLLHGLSDDHRSWVEKGTVKTVADRLLASGEIQAMVIVTPCAGGANVHETWNGYFNMPGWTYEDFFFEELLPYIEQKYHCGGTQQRRAIAGLSMGGGGSVVYAQRHPEMFAAVYAMSGWLHNDSLKHTPRGKLEFVMQSVHDYSAVDFLTHPDRDRVEKLCGVKWFVDCGDDDFLFSVNIDFYRAMRRLHIPCELRVRDGGHDWEYWHTALYTCLPFVSRNMK